jgi:hypothetical protein
MAVAISTWRASAYFPLAKAVIPQHKRHGVLGIARITGVGESSVFSIKLFGTEAATEIIS